MDCERRVCAAAFAPFQRSDQPRASFDQWRELSARRLRMHTIRMWNVVAMAALCCSPMFAQAPGGGGGGMQQPSQPGGSASPSMQQQQQQEMGSMNSPTAGPAMDKEFVKKALEGNMAEVQMGQLA